MRLIVGITCLLLGIGMFSCQMDPGPAAAEMLAGPATPVIDWVRTVDGWERAGHWPVRVQRPPRLHPLVIAAGEGLVSLLGLVLCQRELAAASSRENTRGGGIL